MSKSSPSVIPGVRVAGDVADRVAAALARGEAGVGDLADQLRGVGQRDVVDLDVLAGRDVALVERRVLLDHRGEGVHLLGRDAAHRQLHADHLHVGLALAVDALLEPEADELLLGLLAAQEAAGLGVEVVELALDGSGSGARGRSRRPRGSRASRACPCPSGACGGRRRACARRRSARRRSSPRGRRSGSMAAEHITQIPIGIRVFSAWRDAARDSARPAPSRRRLSRRRCPRSGTRPGRGRGTRRGSRRGSRSRRCRRRGCCAASSAPGSSACLAASSVDVFELPTSSMILTTATLSSFCGCPARVRGR